MILALRSGGAPYLGRMRMMIVLLGLILSPEDSLSVMFWNVENFFDWRNDSTTVSDVEFSAAGERHWTWKRFQAKANAFAKALFWVEAETGHLPDIVGLEEVENAFVLRQVLQKTALRKLDYKYVHFDSPDRRGIDVALLYRSSRLELLDSKPCHLFAADTVMATRDILLCVFRRDSAKVAVLVNHHPSKYGGPALLPLHMDLFRRGLGTIKYDGKWDLIDHIYVSPALVAMPMTAPASDSSSGEVDRPADKVGAPSARARMRILRIPFLLTRDTVHSGEKPLRTYTGPRHTGGVSDHLPVLLESAFSIENNL